MPVLGKAPMDGKPKLIVGDQESLEQLQCLCSHCLRPFHLPSNQPPKEAVAELLHNFRGHVEREHPGAVAGWGVSPGIADKQDGN